MVSQNTGVDTLDQLQTPEQVRLLDEIDNLRQQGLGHHGISLPQLIVCGDQSSGKSSLLEGLTRLRFPTKEGLCTTFATEVVLRRQTDVEITCTIIPGKGRSSAEKRELSKFNQKFSSREDFSFPSVLDEAKDRMALGARSNRGPFFQDVLRIRYAGPDLPSFTIVDLPGIIETQLEGGTGAERVLDLVTEYMRDEKSIIMAVVPAFYDPEIQKVFTYLKQYDPTGSRTLGIITKPDTLDPGCDTEKELMRLARNERFRVGHGWHAVKNRSFATKDQNDDERDESEQKFFSSGVWASFPQKDVGIGSLRTKLSGVLLEHIGKELPSLVSEIQNAISFTQSSLRSLGPARENSKQQRDYLTRHAERFQILTHDALRGIYSDMFFRLESPNQQTPRRLRTRLQNLNIDFADVMYRKGHTWDIVNQLSSNSVTSNHDDLEYDAYFDEPSQIRRSDFLENHIGDYVRHSRSSGLPSIVNPWVIGEVFRQQSQMWREITEHHLKEVFKAMREYIEETCSDLMDNRTCYKLMLEHIEPELERRWASVELKLQELLVPYTEQDPMIYDPSFMKEIEEVRQARYVKTRTPVFGQPVNPSTWRDSSVNLLTESLDDFTNSEILDLMQTYYKRAITVFINNVAVLAIENCLIKDLVSLFSATLVANMNEQKLGAIAAESEDVTTERMSLRQRLEALEGGKQVLRGHLCDVKMAKPGRAKPSTSYPTRPPPRHKNDRPNTPPPKPQPERADTPTTQIRGASTPTPPPTNVSVLPPTPPSSDTKLNQHSRQNSRSPTPTPKTRGMWGTKNYRKEFGSDLISDAESEL